MNDKPSVIRETDEDARNQARIFMHTAAHAALAVIDPETGFPSVSRVLTAMDTDGAPVILVSGLSSHTKALVKDPRASALFGEPGKGDPLAHPRLTVRCSAERVDRQGDAHARIRELFLERHPKSKLYIDFPDFCFFRLVPLDASLNGGFGRAYILSAEDLVIL
ncbi:HugZ family protein [Rhizobium sp. BR 315]|uniref:HugZ family pyridoxamine 5'-phosphate oxidase n=1 Tax=Rhizobium sp. BR 315 TaxID=3040014 RepID=UPI003D3331F4